MQYSETTAESRKQYFLSGIEPVTESSSHNACALPLNFGPCLCSLEPLDLKLYGLFPPYRLPLAFQVKHFPGENGDRAPGHIIFDSGVCWHIFLGNVTVDSTHGYSYI